MANQASVSSMAELSVDAQSGIEMLSESFLQSSAEAEMKLIAQEEAELELDELNNIEKKSKSGFIEIVNDEEKQTISQDLVEVKSDYKMEVVANVFSNTDALTGEKIDDFGVVHSELEPIVTEKAPETM